MFSLKAGPEADVRPETPEERIIWFSITATYLFYLVGGLYVLAPVLALVLHKTKRPCKGGLVL